MADIEMGDQNQFFEDARTSTAASATNDNPPSWVSSIINLLSQFLRNQQTENQYRGPKQVKPSHSQPHPEKFSGIDLSEYPQFRSLLDAKLRIDGEAIGSEEERVWYGFGLLSDTASKRMHPWMEHMKCTESFTVENFMSRLDKAFDDPEKVSKAIDKLNSIRQGNSAFRDFLQEFEHLLLEARGWGWEDPVKKGYLKAALNRELSDRLVSQSEPPAYDEFVSQLRVTSDKLDKMKAWDNQRVQNQNIQPHSPQNVDVQDGGDPMDWEPAQPINISSVQQIPKSRYHQSAQLRATWVSHEEIGRRISAGLCLRCGGRGHIIKGCSMLPAINPNRRNKGQAPSPHVAVTAVNTTGGSTVEVSGNVQPLI